MSLPCKTYIEARDYAQFKANETHVTWFVNRLASSGPMRYEASDRPVTDTSFGASMIGIIEPTNDPATRTEQSAYQQFKSDKEEYGQ